MDITFSYIMKISHKQIELLDVVCKGFQFKGYNDTKTIITRAEAKEAGNLLKQLKASNNRQLPPTIGIL